MSYTPTVREGIFLGLFFAVQFFWLFTAFVYSDTERVLDRMSREAETRADVIRVISLDVLPSMPDIPRTPNINFRILAASLIPEFLRSESFLSIMRDLLLQFLALHRILPAPMILALVSNIVSFSRFLIVWDLPFRRSMFLRVLPERRRRARRNLPLSRLLSMPTTALLRRPTSPFSLAQPQSALVSRVYLLPAPT